MCYNYNVVVAAAAVVAADRHRRGTKADLNKRKILRKEHVTCCKLFFTVAIVFTYPFVIDVIAS